MMKTMILHCLMFSFFIAAATALYLLLAPMPSIATLDNGYEHREISLWNFSSNP